MEAWLYEIPKMLGITMELGNRIKELRAKFGNELGIEYAWN